MGNIPHDMKRHWALMNTFDMDDEAKAGLYAIVQLVMEHFAAAATGADPVSLALQSRAKDSFSDAASRDSLLDTRSDTRDDPGTEGATIESKPTKVKGDDARYPS